MRRRSSHYRALPRGRTQKPGRHRMAWMRHSQVQPIRWLLNGLACPPARRLLSHRCLASRQACSCRRSRANTQIRRLDQHVRTRDVEAVGTPVEGAGG